MQITVTVNGAERTADVEPRMLLVHLIRETLGLTGTHIGCDTSELRRVHRPAGRHAGQVVHDVRASRPTAARSRRSRACRRRAGSHPIQEAFKEEHGLQCGFCTPGMMLVGTALLEREPEPSEDEIRWAISGNICRCTGYMNIVKAIQAAGREMSRRAAAAGRRRPREAEEDATMATETEEIRGIGHSVKRKEDDRFIRGQGNYVDDVKLPGMLHMAILRSPFAHAKINGRSTRRGRRRCPAWSRWSPAS